MKRKLRGIKFILSLMISGILSIGLTQAQCPITTTPATTGGSACGPGSTVTLTGTPGTTQNYIVWYNSNNVIVGSGNTFTTGALAATTTFKASDASTNGAQQHVGPLTSIQTPANPGANFSNGQYFTVFSEVRIDSMTIYTFAPAGGTGSAAGVIIIRDSITLEIIQEVPFSVTGSGAHQIPIGATLSPGKYFINFTRTSGDGILWRTTGGGVYPYTIPGLISITGNNFATQPNTRVYYFFDWVVTPICVGTTVNVTATIQPVLPTTLPYLENFENGLPCDWIRTQATGSPGWQTSTGYTGPLWTVPAHTTFMLANDAACQCNASQDILVSPMFDLSNYNFLDQLSLTYDAFYTGGGTSMAGVLASTDGGTTWFPLDTLAANANWRTETLDISSLASFDSVRIGFLHTDLNLQGTGFGIDNFAISSGGCSGVELQVDIVTDIFGEETLWQIQDINSNAIYAFHGPLNNVNPYNAAAATYNWDVCVPVGATVEFVIVDTYGDGLFDGTNTGTYRVISPCDTVISGSGGYPYGGPGGTAPSYDSVVFTVGAAPIMLGADMNICESSTTAIVLDAGYAVNWSTGATNAQTVSILPANLSLGANTVIATNTATGICATADTIVINVDEQPSAAFTEVKNFLVVNFTNTSTSTGAGTTYSWNFGDGSAVSTAANPSHTYTSGGTYTVTLTVTNGTCTDVTTKTIAVQGIGINDPDLTQSLKVFPNPSYGEVNINIDGSEYNRATVTLYTIHGQTVETYTLTSLNGTINKTIDLSNFGKGVYFIKVESNQKSVMNRIVIQ